MRFGSRQQENTHMISAQCVHFKELWMCGREAGHNFVIWERCAQGSSGETRGKETIGETQT